MRKHQESTNAVMVLDIYMYVCRPMNIDFCQFFDAFLLVADFIQKQMTKTKVRVCTLWIGPYGQSNSLIHSDHVLLIFQDILTATFSVIFSKRNFYTRIFHFWRSYTISSGIIYFFSFEFSTPSFFSSLRFSTLKPIYHLITNREGFLFSS